MRVSLSRAWLAASALIPLASAVDIDWTSDTSIKDGAATVAYGLMKYYTGNNTGDVPGNLPDPYYWWEAGAVFGTMVDYWAYTGDETYVNVTFEAMQHQVGDDGDYMPENQTRAEGNDDQGFWAMAAMRAAEVNFRNPDEDGVQWLAAAQAVFNEYVMRWDAADCAGGLRWQIFTFNNGYTYKNSISNGCFFSLASRLAYYTGNTTYSDWADTIYDWMEGVGFIDGEFNVYDGAGYASGGNCTAIDPVQWTYNAGIFLHGSAVMYNYTNGSALWQARVQGHAAKIAGYFFEDSVLYEPACEPQSTCTTDSLSFKSYITRWMAATIQVAGFTYDTLYPLLQASAQAAALQCSGTATAADGYKGLAGTACGSHWVDGSTWDGTNGVGQQMAALSVIFYSQVKAWNVAAPVSANTGGTSVGDTAGGSDKTDASLSTLKAITAGDRVGAAFMTTAVIGGLLGGCFFMIKD